MEFQSAYVAGVKTAYPDYLWIGATDEHGLIVVATDPSTLGRDYSAEPWFQAARNGQGAHMGDVEPFAVMGGPDAIAVTAPIPGPRGEFLGVVTTRVGIPGLENIMTGTLRSFRQRKGFWGALEYQFLTEKGVAFIDSDLEHKGLVNLKYLVYRRHWQAKVSCPIMSRRSTCVAMCRSSLAMPGLKPIAGLMVCVGRY